MDDICLYLNLPLVLFFGWYIKETIPEIVIAVMMYYLPH